MYTELRQIAQPNAALKWDQGSLFYGKISLMLYVRKFTVKFYVCKILRLPRIALIVFQVSPHNKLISTSLYTRGLFLVYILSPGWRPGNLTGDLLATSPCWWAVGVCRGLSTPFSSEANLTMQSKGTLLMKMVGDFAIWNLQDLLQWSVTSRRCRPVLLHTAHSSLLCCLHRHLPCAMICRWRPILYIILRM